MKEMCVCVCVCVFYVHPCFTGAKRMGQRRRECLINAPMWITLAPKKRQTSQEFYSTCQHCWVIPPFSINLWQTREEGMISLNLISDVFKHPESVCALRMECVCVCVSQSLGNKQH